MDFGVSYNNEIDVWGYWDIFAGFSYLVNSIIVDSHVTSTQYVPRWAIVELLGHFLP